MNKAHANQNWENYPSINTPVNAQNLNKLDVSVDLIDDRVISLDTTKFDKSEAQTLVKNIQFNRSNGVFTITLYNGSSFTIDTLLEKLAVNFDFDIQTQQLIIILDDGEKKYVDLSKLITQYEFDDTETIAFAVNDSGHVSAIVKEGSINEKHLRPEYLADIKLEQEKAKASQEAAAKSEANAAASETAAANSASSAAESAAATAASETNAKTSAENAANSEESAAASKDEAKKSEENAASSAASADASANIATNKATEAGKSATNAASSETSAAASAKEAESFAHGETGTREGENTDNAKFYSDIALSYKDGAKEYSDSVKDSMEQINKKLELTAFDVDENGNLIYTDNSSYNFWVSDDGNLNWEVAA